MNDLTIGTRTATSGPVIELAGTLDHDSAAEVRARLAHLDLRTGQVLVVDLAGVTFCDSSGITVLIAARNLALQADAEIVLAAVPERIGRIFRIVGLDKVFATRPTARSATDAWESSVA